MNIGDKVPELLGQDETGKTWYSSELLGKTWILYFYPKDNTSGCTDEACSFRDSMEEIAKAGYTLIGVSRDSASSHRRFKEKLALPYPLIADTERKLHQEMGVLYPKKMYGKEVIGTLRSTFIINEGGTIVKIFQGKEIDTSIHARQVLEAIIDQDK